MAVVNRRAETKKQMVEICENKIILHNVLTNLMVNVFVTKVGTAGDNIFPSTSNCRIGNQIYVKGLKMSIMIESQQYRPAATYDLYLVRKISDPGTEITTQADMFEKVSDTIPCDYIDPTKVHILFHKKFKPRMPNSGTTVAMSQDGTGTLFNGGAYEYSGNESYNLFTNPQSITKFYVPLNRKIKYLDYGDNTNGICIGPHYYQWVMTCYNNFSTKTGANNYPVGRVTLAQQMLFTDI